QVRSGVVNKGPAKYSFMPRVSGSVIHVRRAAAGLTKIASDRIDGVPWALSPRLRRRRTQELTSGELNAIRAMLVATFAADGDDFSLEDWQHALRGMHVIVDLDGRIVAHGSVVQRALQIGGVSLRTGYVEAVATAPTHQRGGLGTRTMTNIGA